MSQVNIASLNIYLFVCVCVLCVLTWHTTGRVQRSKGNLCEAVFVFPPVGPRSETQVVRHGSRATATHYAILLVQKDLFLFTSMCVTLYVHVTCVAVPVETRSC